MSTDNDPQKVGSLRGVDHEKINDLVDHVDHTLTFIENAISEVMDHGILSEISERGIVIGYFPLGWLTITLGPSKDDK